MVVKRVTPLMVALILNRPQQAVPDSMPPAMPKASQASHRPTPMLAVPPPDALLSPEPELETRVVAPDPAAARTLVAGPLVALTSPVSVASSAPAPAAMPAPRRQLAASAVRYLVPPPAEVPRASHRAGESGTVWLRVVVDTNGRPAQVLVHRSSGFARLDEQALWAMRQARFKPYSEDGRAVEVEVIAPIEYPAD